MRIVQGSFGSWQCVVRTCIEDTYVSNNIFHVRRRCKLKLIYNSGSPTRHDFVLAAKQTLLPLPTTWLSRANNYAKLPVLGRIARILSILSTPFLTFTDAFLRYGATIREREKERERYSTSARAVVVRIVDSKSFGLMTYIVIFGMMDTDFLFKIVEIVVEVLAWISWKI